MCSAVAVRPATPICSAPVILTAKCSSKDRGSRRIKAAPRRIDWSSCSAWNGWPIMQSSEAVETWTRSKDDEVAENDNHVIAPARRLTTLPFPLPRYAIKFSPPHPPIPLHCSTSNPAPHVLTSHFPVQESAQRAAMAVSAWTPANGRKKESAVAGIPSHNRVDDVARDGKRAGLRRGGREGDTALDDIDSR